MEKYIDKSIISQYYKVKRLIYIEITSMIRISKLKNKFSESYRWWNYSNYALVEWIFEIQGEFLSSLSRFPYVTKERYDSIL